MKTDIANNFAQHILAEAKRYTQTQGQMTPCKSHVHSNI